MSAFYTETITVQTNPGVGPIEIVESFERDREVLLKATNSGLHVGFTEAAVTSAGDGWPVETSLLRFVLPADTSLWLNENTGSPSSIGLNVLVAAT